MLTNMAFDGLHFFQRLSWRIKLLQQGYCKVKVSEREYLGHRGQEVKVTLQFYRSERYNFYNV